ncbi:hypothetical protein BH23PLA1_BH23PLA1_01120 [soil metagenome]
MESADAGTATGTETETRTGAETESKVKAISGGPLPWDDSVGPVPLVAGADAEPVVLDWFGRGEPDLLVSAIGGPKGRIVRIYRQTSPIGDFPGTYDEGEPIEALAGLRQFCAIPNGRNSRFDLVAIAPGGLVLLPNQGDADRPRFGPAESLGLPADLGIGPGRVAQMVSIDWDGDGLIDLLVGFDDLEGYWPDQEIPTTQQLGFNRNAGHPGYDRDGRWRGQPARGKVVWLKNLGQVGSPRFELQDPVATEAGPLGLAHRPAALMLSWGPSRAAELLVTDALGEVCLFRNFGGQTPPVLLEPRPLRMGVEPLRLPDDHTTLSAADIDRDRRIELIFGTAEGRVFAVHSGTGRDDALISEPLLQESRTLRLGGSAMVSVADLDADGGLDLVHGDATGRLYWTRDLGGPGDHRYAAPVELESAGERFRLDPGPDGRLLGPIAPALGFACPTLIDWKGNGRPDLIVNGAGGEVIFLRNSGSAREPRYDIVETVRCQGAPLITPPRVRLAAADWDGNGQVDLIGLDLQGFLCVFPREGMLEVGAPIPLVDRLGRLIRLDGAFGRNGLCALWAGDWTGSGRLDLLVGLPLGNRFVVPALTGEPLTDLDALPTVLLLENIGRGVLVPRPLRFEDGRPVVVGYDGCSPCGIDWAGDGTLDLLVGADDGTVLHVPRSLLRW